MSPMRPWQLFQEVTRDSGRSTPKGLLMVHALCYVSTHGNPYLGRVSCIFSQVTHHCASMLQELPLIVVANSRTRRMDTCHWIEPNNHRAKVVTGRQAKSGMDGSA